MVAPQKISIVRNVSRACLQASAISLRGSLSSSTTQGYCGRLILKRADMCGGVIRRANQAGAGSSSRPISELTITLPFSLTRAARTWRCPSKLDTTCRRVTVCCTSLSSVSRTEFSAPWKAVRTSISTTERACSDKNVPPHNSASTSRAAMEPRTRNCSDMSIRRTMPGLYSAGLAGREKEPSFREIFPDRRDRGRTPACTQIGEIGAGEGMNPRIGPGPVKSIQRREATAAKGETFRWTVSSACGPTGPVPF